MDPDFAVGLVESIPLMVLVLAEDGRITYASPPTEEMTGYRPAEIVGTPIFDYLRQESTALLLGSMGYVLDYPDIPYGPVWIPVVHADGRTRVYEVTATNRYSDPVVGGLVVVARDHTLQAKLNEATASHDAASDRLEVLGLITEAALGLPLRARACFLDPDGRRLVGDLPASLFDPRPGDGRPAPWQEALSTGEPAYPPSLDDFDASLREAAAADGLATIWALPIPAPDGSPGAFSGCLVIGRRAERIATVNERRGMELMLQVAALVYERDHHLEILGREARTDALTGLSNRRHLLRSAAGGPGGPAQGDELPDAVLYVDLDDFKQINDEFGHEAGDAVLRVVADRLRHACREQDEVGRVGGDEFLVLLTGPLEIAEVTDVADRVIAACTEPVKMPGADGQREVSIGASVGIACAHTGGDEDLAELIRAADDALYRAKQAGGGRWQLAPGDMVDRA